LKLLIYILLSVAFTSFAEKFISPDSILVSGHDTLFRAETQMRFDRFPTNFANENFANDSIKKTYTFTQGGIAVHLDCKTPWLDLEFVDRAEGAQINRFAVHSVCGNEIKRYTNQKFRVESCDSTQYKNFEIWLPSTWAVDLWSVKSPDNAQCKLPKLKSKAIAALLGGVQVGSVVDTIDGKGAGYDLLSSQLSRLSNITFLNKAMTNTPITLNNYKSIPDSIDQIFIYWGYSDIWNGASPKSITQSLIDLTSRLLAQNPSRNIHFTSWHSLSTSWRKRVLERSKHNYDEYQNIFPDIQKTFMWNFSGQLFFHDTKGIIDTTCTLAEKYNCDLAAGAFLSNKGTKKIALRIASSWDSLKNTPQKHHLKYSKKISLREGISGQKHTLPDSLENQKVLWRLVHGPLDLSLNSQNELLFSSKRNYDTQDSAQTITLALSDGHFVDTFDIKILIEPNNAPQINLDSGTLSYTALPNTFIQSKFEAEDHDNDSLFWIIKNTPWVKWQEDTTSINSASINKSYKIQTTAILPKQPNTWNIPIGVTDLIDTTWIDWSLTVDESVSEGEAWSDILGRKNPCTKSSCTRGVSIKKSKVLLRAY
jgi:hypothetical protein